MTNLMMACFAGGLAAQTSLDVHVYDWAKVSASTLERTAKELARIFRVSGIELRWIVEPPDSPEASKVVLVDPPPRGRERQAACAARRDIALSILPASSAKPQRTVLGYAEPLASAGINVTIDYARVASTADEHGISTGVLLAHAIAHEIGHVLLRTASHRKGGLMSGHWGAGQFRHIRTPGMFFDKADARSMQSAIKGEGCELLVATK
jgi:hypothetical protein